jgi:hypothetical protein
MVASSRKRTDNRGRAFAGSQLQVQIYVSRRQSELSAAVLEALAASGERFTRVTWVSPLEERKFYEPRDGRFLEAVGAGAIHSQLTAFWPARGPRWDALAILEPDSAVLLVEGKSYPGEMLGRGCLAGADSRRAIDTSLRNAQVFFRVEETATWAGPLYQYANRLAHVYFLRAIGARPAFLANLCFLGDPIAPTDRPTFEREIDQYKRQLGFPQGIPYTVDVYVPARPRRELLDGVA